MLGKDKGARSSAGGTADHLVNGKAYDVVTPITDKADRIVSRIAEKGDQAYGVVVDMSQTPVKAAELGDILRRVQGTGSHVRDVILLFGD